MSKAFTRESDDDVPDLPVLPRAAALLPPGTKNYLTPAGALRLRRELNHLVQAERPTVAASSDGDAKRKLQALDQRIIYLQEVLQTAVITGPPPAPHDIVRFGAIVRVRERTGAESTYQIVGVDETDLDQNRVSWVSPIAKALLNSRTGERVRFKFPAGEEELEILSVSYE
jgi:transcription elongation factor GreB